MFWKFAYPSLIFYHFTDGQFHHEYPVTAFYSDFRERSQNSRELPCGTNFIKILPILPTFMGYRMEVGGCFSEFCECSQNSHSRVTYTAPLVS